MIKMNLQDKNSKNCIKKCLTMVIKYVKGLKMHVAWMVETCYSERIYSAVMLIRIG